jgi:hypothetical protein
MTFRGLKIEGKVLRLKVENSDPDSMNDEESMWLRARDRMLKS